MAAGRQRGGGYDYSGAVYVKAAGRRANYRVQRLGIKMTGLGSRSSGKGRSGSYVSAW